MPGSVALIPQGPYALIRSGVSADLAGGPRFERTDRAGRFRFAGVTSGNYDLVGTAATGTELRLASTASVRVDPGAAATVDLIDGAGVAVSVSFGWPGASPDAARPTVILEWWSGPLPGLGSISGAVDGGGSTRLSDVPPGRYRVSVQGLPAGHRVADVNGSAGLTVAVTGGVADSILRIPIVDELTGVSGTVTSPDGSPVTDVLVGLTPVNVGEQTEDVVLVRPSTKGRFARQGLEPGEYLVGLVELSGGVPLTPEVATALRSSSVPISIRARETVTVHLRTPGRS
jgi:hypothetical protein